MARAGASWRLLPHDFPPLSEAKRGFVLLPRRGVVARRFGGRARFRRLARDEERWPKTLAGLHLIAFAILVLARLMRLLLESS
jgi:transposase